MLPGLIILPYDISANKFQRLLLANLGPYSMPAFQTSVSTGVITFTTLSGGSTSFNAASFIQAQQVQALIDAFVLSGDNFIDLSSKLPLQLLYDAIAGTGSTGQQKLPAVGNPVMIFGAGFTPATSMSLQNAAATVTAGVTSTFITPGWMSFAAPDNTIAPWNGLDTTNTNNLIVSNPDGTTFSSANAPTAFSFGWT